MQIYRSQSLIKPPQGRLFIYAPKFDKVAVTSSQWLKRMHPAFVPVIFLVSLLFSGLTVAQHSQKLLFIGNSFTFFNQGIDHHVAALARHVTPSQELFTQRNAFGGETLKGHVTRRDTVEVIAKHNWDHVILQGYSNEPITDYARFEKYALRLTNEARDAGATVHLLMTWAYRKQPAMTEKLQRAYERAARNTATRAIPAGAAFALAVQRQPQLNLYSDNKHPNTAGTYLAACVVYQWLFDIPSSQSRYYGGLSPQQARFLQQVASDTVTQFKPNKMQ